MRLLSAKSVMILVSLVCFALTGVAASAQTLTVVQPTSHFHSPPLWRIGSGAAPVNGPTEIHVHKLPLAATARGDGGGVDAAAQTKIGRAS